MSVLQSPPALGNDLPLNQFVAHIVANLNHMSDSVGGTKLNKKRLRELFVCVPANQKHQTCNDALSTGFTIS